MENEGMIDLGGFDDTVPVMVAARRLVDAFLARLEEKVPHWHQQVLHDLIDGQGDFAVVCYIKGKHVAIELHQGLDRKILHDSVIIEP